MHHGSALQRGADVIGHDVNVAARIVDVAAPGEVLVSDAVHAGVDPRPADVCFTELGPVVMKGISGPIRLWRASPC
jgi:class 3 adenylate cyclase